MCEPFATALLPSRVSCWFSDGEVWWSLVGLPKPRTQLSDGFATGVSDGEVWWSLVGLPKPRTQLSGWFAAGVRDGEVWWVLVGLPKPRYRSLAHSRVVGLPLVSETVRFGGCW